MGLVQKALQGEVLSSLLWIFLFGFVIGAAISLFDIAAVSNFITVFDYTYLPGGFISSGLIGIFAANSYISFQNWISYSRVAFLTLLIVSVSFLVLLCWSALHGSDSIAYVSFILTGPVTTVGLLVFRGLFERIFDLSQSKKYLSLAESGIVGGSILSLCFTCFLFSLSGKPVSELIFYSFLFCLMSFIVLLAISLKYDFLTKIIINVQYIKAFNDYSRLVRKRYTLLLVLFSFLSATGFYFTEYFFLCFTDQEYHSGNDILQFLSGFSASAIAIGFLFKILIASKINEKYGLLVSLFILPALVFLFTAIFGGIGSFEGYQPEESVFFFIFMIACISRLASYSLFHSVESFTFRNFFIPLDSLLREDIQSKVSVVVKEAAKVFVSVIIATVLYYFNFEFLPYLLLVVLVVSMYAAFQLSEAYKEKLRITLDNPEKIVKKARLSENVMDELERRLVRNEDNRFEIYLSLVKILDPVRYKKIIIQLIPSDNEEIQSLALKEAGELCLLDCIPVLEKVKESKFYPILKTRELVDRVYDRLKAAEFRLEKVKYIEQLTLSKITKERIYGALLSAFSEEESKPRLLVKLFRDESEKVRYSAVLSSVNTSNRDLQKFIIEKLGDSVFSNAALSSVVHSGESYFQSMENAFYISGLDEKIQLRIVQAYGRTGTETAVQLLIKKLSYTNQNVASAAFEELSQCGYTIEGERTILLKAELEEYVSVLAWNISALIDLQNNTCSDLLMQAMSAEIDSNYDRLFKILSLLYDPSVMALVRNNIFSEDSEKSEYAYGLLEVTLQEREKALLLPVLNNSSPDEKKKRIDPYFPWEPGSVNAILYDLIQRDYKYVNRWTKACALKELSASKEKVDPEIFLANVVNPDSLLKETALISLFIKNPDLIPSSFDRFRKELQRNIDQQVINEILLPNERHSLNLDIFQLPHLKFEMINYLRKVKEFSEVPGVLLMKVANLMEFKKVKQGERVAECRVEEMDYFLVRNGSLIFELESKYRVVFKENSFIHHFLLSDLTVKIVAETDAEIYRIKKHELNELMSYHQELPVSFMNHCYKCYAPVYSEQEVIL